MPGYLKIMQEILQRAEAFMKCKAILIYLFICLSLLIGCTKKVLMTRDTFVSDQQKIVGIVLKSGTDLKFPDAGAMYNRTTKNIYGLTTDGKMETCNLSLIKHIYVASIQNELSTIFQYGVADFQKYYHGDKRSESYKKILEVHLVDGKVIRFTDQSGGSLSLDNGSISGYSAGGYHVNIPLDSILYVKVVQADQLKTALLLTSVAAVMVVAIIAAVPDKEPEPDQEPIDPYWGNSCPLIHSYNKGQYILDAQPLSGALCPAMARSEISELKSLTPVDNEYRLIVRNEIDETEYVDHLSLFYIDYPQNHRIIYDTAGTAYHIGEICEPVSATDEQGRDILNFFQDSDKLFWQSHMPLDTLFESVNEQHQLTFKFNKPTDAKSCVLVVNGGTSQWGSRMIKNFLQHKGNLLPNWLRALSTDTSELAKLNSLLKREELYLLQINLLEDSQFQPHGYIHSGGPAIFEDRAMRLDLSQVSGDTLTIRLNPPFGFWSIDFLGVAFDEYDIPQSNRLDLIAAHDQDENNIVPQLSQPDKNYHIMPDKGNYFSAIYSTPIQAPAEGLTRSVFSQTSGFYFIHMDTTAVPQMEKIAQLENLPGASVDISMEEYRDFLKSKYRGD
jgi:hypothetical protein